MFKIRGSFDYIRDDYRYWSSKFGWVTFEEADSFNTSSISIEPNTFPTAIVRMDNKWIVVRYF